MLLLLVSPFARSYGVLAEPLDRGDVVDELYEDDLIDGDWGVPETEPIMEAPPLGEISPEEILKNAAIINISTFSLSDFGTLQTDGAINIADYLNEEQFEQMISQLGYNPSFSWKAGDSFADLMTVGDLSTDSTIANWSLTTVAEANTLPGQAIADVGQTALSDYKLPFKGNLEDLIEALPITKNLRVRNVRPIFDWMKQKLGWDDVTAARMGGQTLSRLANNNNFSGLTFEDFDFSPYTVDEIPGLKDVSFSDFRAWEQAKVSDIPNMNTAPLQKYMQSFGEYYDKVVEVADYLNMNWVPFARVDVVYGPKEGNQKNPGRKSVSGSNVVGYNVVCEADSCPYIELTDFFGLNIPLFGVHGKAWFDGYHTPWVPGGTGMFTGIPEPTGRNPATNFFKMVITNTSESDGRADLGINGRVCFWWGIQHCTPYVLGPAPFPPVYENQFIVLGLDYFGNWGSSGGVSGGSGLSAAQQQWVETLAQVAPEVYTQISQYASSGNSGTNYGNPSAYEEGVDTTASCSRYQGVHMGYLRKAFANKESRGSGDYQAVGVHVVADGGANRGRALGKYQIMTYEPEIRTLVGSQSGGAEFLSKIAANVLSESEIQAQLSKFFPPALQEKAIDMQFKRRLSAARKPGMTESDLVYEMAGWYNPINGGHNASYAQGILDEYKNQDNRIAVNQQCGIANRQGQCKGKLIIPMTGTLTSGYGPRWGKMHNGIDLANAIGTPVLASDGGVVIDVVNTCSTQGVYGSTCGGGFGNRVYIRHCNGLITRYAHLNRANVRLNQKVLQGQQIGQMGNSGSSTGPHLHFEVVVNGARVNPVSYLPSLSGG